MAIIDGVHGLDRRIAAYEGGLNRHREGKIFTLRNHAGTNYTIGPFLSIPVYLAIYFSKELQGTRKLHLYHLKSM